MEGAGHFSGNIRPVSSAGSAAFLQFYSLVGLSHAILCGPAICDSKRSLIHGMDDTSARRA